MYLCVLKKFNLRALKRTYKTKELIKLSALKRTYKINELIKLTGT